jgi:hypothetical protein
VFAASGREVVDKTQVYISTREKKEAEGNQTRNPNATPNTDETIRHVEL